jgi:hypothetical protein
MKLEWKSLVSLKTSVIVAFVLLWNAGFFMAMHLGGGGLRGGLTPIGMEITGYACLAVTVFGLSVATLKPVQLSLIEPSRSGNFNPKEFYFLAFVSGVLAISRFTFPVIEAGTSAL